MKVSLNSIKQFTDVTIPVNELVSKINQQLGTVESVVDLGARYEGVVVAKVVECIDHPNADRLRVCKIDDGNVVEGVERDENGLVQVVCGAPNVRADMSVVWLPPKSTVPATYGEKDSFVLDSRELRGVVSNGMLASPKELAINDSHDGILEIDSEGVDSTTQMVPGTSFASAYGLDDTIITIENKMFTHRPDCFGQLGVAREIAGIQQQAFVSPKWYSDTPAFDSGNGLELQVQNESPNLVPRLMAVAIKGVTIKPSPLWLQLELVRLGSKPINNVVDATNYIMLLTGQPTHAYDYDKLRGHVLMARNAAPDESVTLLNGKTYQLTADDIVIADGEGPVGLAGIMGGGTSEVSNNTQHIVLECATFDMYALRKSSMRHGVFTDALTRFNKGQSPLQNPYVLKLLLNTIFDVAGGELASEVYDMNASVTEQQSIDITSSFVNERLGLSLGADEMSQLLRNVEFTVHSGETLTVTPPFWRTDIRIKEDIVEEVGRLYGYELLPRELPIRSIMPPVKNEIRELKMQVRESLSRSGANEVLTYSFVHEKVMLNAGQNPADAYALSNALSPDLHYYRHSVLPSLLDKVHMNIKTGHDEFVLFEIGKGHNKNHVDNEGLPDEFEFVDAVYANKKSRPGAAFYMIRQYIDQLAADLGIGQLIFKPITDALDFPLTAPFELTRSASIETKEGVFLGLIGELRQQVKKQFKLPQYASAMSLDLEGLLKASATARPLYTALPRFPHIHQDLSLEVADTMNAQDILGRANDTVSKHDLGDVHFAVTLVDIYRAEGSSKKTLTLRLEIASYERTLKESEVTTLINQIASDAQHAFGAVKK